MFVAHAVKNVPPGVDLVGHVAKPSTVVGQYFGCLVGDSGQHSAQKIGRQYFRGTRLQPGESQLAGAVDGYKGIDAPFFGVGFGKINVQVAHGVVLELLSLPCGRGGRQAAGAMALEQAVQGRAGKGRNYLLQGVEAIIQGQQGVLAEDHGRGVCLGREHRRDGFGAHRGVGRGGALTPLSHRFGG